MSFILQSIEAVLEILFCILGAFIKNRTTVSLLITSFIIWYCDRLYIEISSFEVIGILFRINLLFSICYYCKDILIKFQQDCNGKDLLQFCRLFFSKVFYITKVLFLLYLIYFCYKYSIIFAALIGIFLTLNCIHYVCKLVKRNSFLLFPFQLLLAFLIIAFCYSCAIIYGLYSPTMIVIAIILLRLCYRYAKNAFTILVFLILLVFVIYFFMAVLYIHIINFVIIKSVIFFHLRIIYTSIRTFIQVIRTKNASEAYYFTLYAIYSALRFVFIVSLTYYLCFHYYGTLFIICIVLRFIYMAYADYYQLKKDINVN